MSDDPEVMCVMNSADGISVAIKLPVRSDGALPYLLAEVRAETVIMFQEAMKAVAEWGLIDIEDDLETTEDT